MHALAIDRDDAKGRGDPARGCAGSTGFGSRAPMDHHQSNPAHSLTSQRRRLTGARRSGPFIPGWGCALNELAAVRRLIASGVEERAATHLASDHPQASGAVQGFSDLPEFHPSNSFVRSSNASTTSRKRFADEQNLSAAGVKSD